MKLKDLIDRNPVFNKAYFYEWYCRPQDETIDDPDEHYESHLEVFNKLKQMKPYTEPSEYPVKIAIGYTSKEQNDDWDYHSVSGLSLTSDESYAIEFRPWPEWLDMNIDEETLSSYLESEIIVHCIWEMTFCGYDNDDVQQQWSGIVWKCDKIKQSNIDQLIKDGKVIPLSFNDDEK